MPLDNNIGYLEQGYANVAVAPLEMQLQEMQSRRIALEQAKAGLRKTNYDEQERIKSDMLRDQYFGYKMGQDKDLTDEQTIAQDGEYFKNNPTVGADKQVREIFDRDVTVAGKIASRGSLSNTRRQQEAISRDLDFSEKNSEKMNELSEQQIGLGFQKVQAERQQMDDLQNHINDGKVDEVAYSVAAAYGDSEENEATKTSAVAFTDKLTLSDRPEDRKLLSAIGSISSGLKFGSQLSQVYSSSLSRHKDFIGSMKDFQVDVLATFSDPATRKEELVEMGKMIRYDIANNKRTTFNEGTLVQLGEFGKSLSKVSAVEATYSGLKTTFDSSMKELWKLQGSTKPEDLKRMDEITSGLKVSAKKVRGYVAIEFENKERIEKEHSAELANRKAVAGLRRDLHSEQVDRKRLAQNDLREINNQNYRKAKSNKEKFDTITQMDKDMSWVGTGINPKATRDEKMIYMDGVETRNISSGGGPTLNGF